MDNLRIESLPANKSRFSLFCVSRTLFANHDIAQCIKAGRIGIAVRVSITELLIAIPANPVHAHNSLRAGILFQPQSTCASNSAQLRLIFIQVNSGA